jgi:carbonic anhydrase/acetyltransferase-like protein (isoleucine patch superfamily)
MLLFLVGIIQLICIFEEQTQRSIIIRYSFKVSKKRARNSTAQVLNINLMALIKSVRGFSPQFGNNCYLAENATVIGNTIMGDDCSVWFQAVVRGDVNEIRIGNKVNIQDGAIIHCTYERAPTIIGNNVSIGHRAIVHGCTLHDNILVGMGAMIMDHVVVESNCLIAAGAVVLEKSHLESNCIYAGVPAKKVKELSPEQFADTIGRISNAYVMYASWFQED